MARETLTFQYGAHGTHGIMASELNAENFANKRESLNQSKLSDASKLNKLLNFIREQNSRQEHEPLLGNLIDNGFVEPLHNTQAD